MLISVFFAIGFRSVPSRFMMMSGRHKLLALIQTAEAATNLTLSIILVKYTALTEYIFGIMHIDYEVMKNLPVVAGVILGTLIPKAVISLFVTLPYMCAFIREQVVISFVRVYILPVCAMLPCAGLIVMLRKTVPDFTWTFHGLAFTGITAFIIYMTTVFFICLDSSEKKTVITYIRGKLERILKKH